LYIAHLYIQIHIYIHISLFYDLCTVVVVAVVSVHSKLFQVNYYLVIHLYILILILKSDFNGIVW